MLSKSPASGSENNREPCRSPRHDLAFGSGHVALGIGSHPGRATLHSFEVARPRMAVAPPRSNPRFGVIGTVAFPTEHDRIAPSCARSRCTAASCAGVSGEACRPGRLGSRGDSFPGTGSRSARTRGCNTLMVSFPEVDRPDRSPRNENSHWRARLAGPDSTSRDGSAALAFAFARLRGRGVAHATVTDLLPSSG